MIPKFVVHLLSGGLDSVVLLYDLKQQACRIHCALIDYGQRHSKELAWAKHHCERLGVSATKIVLPQLRGSVLTDGSGGVAVPNRNAVFLSLAVNLAQAAGADEVTFAANSDDHEVFPDCRRQFVAAYNGMLIASGITTRVCAPYMDKPKSWIAALGADLGVKFDETWSCYAGGVQPCGKCLACKTREKALQK